MQVDHLPRTSGIYKITCTANGKIYIGSSVNLYKRGCDHRRLMLKNKHHSRHVQHAHNKHGIDSFYIEVVELCDVEMLITREQHYIDTLKPRFNSSPTAGSTLGIKRSTETRAKISAIQRGRKASDETRAKMSAAMRGIKKPPEAIKKAIETKKNKSPEAKAELSIKLSAWQIGKKLSDETKAKISASKKGTPSYNKGKTFSAESRLKMSLAKKGKPTGKRNTPVSEETKAKISAANTGKRHTEETKLKMSKTRKGKNRVGMKHSEESKLKMSESAKRRCERKRQEKEKPP